MSASFTHRGGTVDVVVETHEESAIDSVAERSRKMEALKAQRAAASAKRRADEAGARRRADLEHVARAFRCSVEIGFRARLREVVPSLRIVEDLSAWTQRRDSAFVDFRLDADNLEVMQDSSRRDDVLRVASRAGGLKGRELADEVIARCGDLRDATLHVVAGCGEILLYDGEYGIACADADEIRVRVVARYSVEHPEYILIVPVAAQKAARDEFDRAMSGVVEKLNRTTFVAPATTGIAAPDPVRTWVRDPVTKEWVEQVVVKRPGFGWGEDLAAKANELIRATAGMRRETGAGAVVPVAVDPSRPGAYMHDGDSGTERTSAAWAREVSRRLADRAALYGPSVGWDPE